MRAKAKIEVAVKPEMKEAELCVLMALNMFDAAFPGQIRVSRWQDHTQLPVVPLQFLVPFPCFVKSLLVFFRQVRADLKGPLACEPIVGGR